VSYKFDGVNDELYANYGAVKGALASAYNLPVTIAYFVKIPSVVASFQYPFNFATSNASMNASLGGTIYASTTDQFSALTIDTGGSALNSTYNATADSFDAATVGTTYNATSGWFGVVATFDGSSTTVTSRRIYVGSTSNASTAQSTSVDLGAQLAYLYFGETATGGGDLGAADPNQYKLAELAVWNEVLDTTEIANYLSGMAAPSVNNTTLIAYWPLSADTSQSDGTDAVGALVVGGPVLDTGDNPTITGGTLIPLLGQAVF
jgi:hypothetical protein